MIQRAYDLVPKKHADELLRLAKISRDWCLLRNTGVDGRDFVCGSRVSTWITKYADGEPVDSASRMMLWSMSLWLLDGPKIFRPIPEQCRALEQIELRLSLSDYAQPYPVMLIDLPDGQYAPFNAVLCHHGEGFCFSTATYAAPNHSHDVLHNFIKRAEGIPIEESLHTFEDRIDSDVRFPAIRVIRVALNSCLALVNFGCHAELLFPKEAESDRRLAQEDSPRALAARHRLKIAIKEVKFDREVVLHRTVASHHSSQEPPRREMPFHWRRGHWAMQAHGPKFSLRKRILRPPVMVRTDKLPLGQELATTTYRT